MKDQEFVDVGSEGHYLAEWFCRYPREALEEENLWPATTQPLRRLRQPLSPSYDTALRSWLEAPSILARSGHIIVEELARKLAAAWPSAAPQERSRRELSARVSLLEQRLLQLEERMRALEGTPRTDAGKAISDLMSRITGRPWQPRSAAGDPFEIAAGSGLTEEDWVVIREGV